MKFTGNEEFSGSLEVDGLTIEEIMDLGEEIVKMKTVSDEEDPAKNFKLMRRLLSELEKRVKNVDLKHTSGAEFKSYEELKKSPLSNQLRQELAMKLIAMNTLGEPKGEGLSKL